MIEEDLEELMIGLDEEESKEEHDELMDLLEEEDEENGGLGLEAEMPDIPHLIFGNPMLSGGGDQPGLTITDKEFYKQMQKLKDRGTNAVPPKKSASAYILFGKEVSDPIDLLAHSFT